MNFRNKSNFLILEIGRQKEVYQYFFIHKIGVNFNEYERDVKDAIRKAASNLCAIQQNNDGKIVTDFDIHFEAINCLTKMNYQATQPKILMFNNSFQGKNDSFIRELQLFASQFNIIELQTDGQDKFFVFMEWNEFDHDCISKNAYSFGSSSKFPTDEILVCYENFHILQQKINGQSCTKTNENLIIKKLNKLKNDFLNNISLKLQTNDFSPFEHHEIFLFSNHALSDHLTSVIGDKLHKQLIKNNHTLAQFKINKTTTIPAISKENSEEDLPF